MLQEYQFDVVHVPGRCNELPDFLLRNPDEANQEDDPVARLHHLEDEGEVQATGSREEKGAEPRQVTGPAPTDEVAMEEDPDDPGALLQQDREEEGQDREEDREGPQEEGQDREEGGEGSQEEGDPAGTRPPEELEDVALEPTLFEAVKQSQLDCEVCHTDYLRFVRIARYGPETPGEARMYRKYIAQDGLIWRRKEEEYYKRANRMDD